MHQASRCYEVHADQPPISREQMRQTFIAQYLETMKCPDTPMAFWSNM